MRHLLTAFAEEDFTSNLSLDDMVDAAQEAFLLYGRGEFIMPTRMHIGKKENTYLLMPCFARNLWITKLVSVIPGNPDEGLPLIRGVAMLADSENGEPLAHFDSSLLTSWRTGASAALALSVLAENRRKNSIGIIGAGLQGVMTAIFACHMMPVREIYLVNRSAGKIDHFQRKLQVWHKDVRIIPSDGINVLLKNDLIVTATSSSTPVLPDNQADLEGKAFVAIGSYSPRMQELPDAVYQIADTVYVDTFDALAESGDLINPLKKKLITDDQVKAFSSLLKETRETKGKTLVYKSVGMALFDLTLARKLFHKMSGQA